MILGVPHPSIKGYLFKLLLFYVRWHQSGTMPIELCDKGMFFLNKKQGTGEIFLHFGTLFANSVTFLKKSKRVNRILLVRVPHACVRSIILLSTLIRYSLC